MVSKTVERVAVWWSGGIVGEKIGEANKFG
jgi:hypothetical protein